MLENMKDTWDYRVVRQTIEDGEELLGIQEVYYDDETGEPMAHTMDLEVVGDSITDLKETLQRMLRCLDKEIIDEIESKIPDTLLGEDGHGSYIYESPDDGNTIYRREMGSDDRTTHHVTKPGTLATGDLADVMPDSALEEYTTRLQIKELKDRLSELEDRVIKGL
jgi:hypothetical protein